MRGPGDVCGPLRWRRRSACCRDRSRAGPRSGRSEPATAAGEPLGAGDGVEPDRRGPRRRGRPAAGRPSARRPRPDRQGRGRRGRLPANTSASPSVPTVSPIAPASSWSRARATLLWVLTCGRSATPRASSAAGAGARSPRRRRGRGRAPGVSSAGPGSAGPGETLTASAHVPGRGHDRASGARPAARCARVTVSPGSRYRPRVASFISSRQPEPTVPLPTRSPGRSADVGRGTGEHRAEAELRIRPRALADRRAACRSRR